MDSPKYNRTMHLPWSPGGTSDDKRASSVESLLNTPIIITEKMDGSNTSLEAGGCFARTHAGAPTHPSFDGLKALHAQIKYKIVEGNQYFGEWCYAVHSIPYNNLPSYFLLFGIRYLDYSGWASWDAIMERSWDLGLHTVPILWLGSVKTSKELEELTTSLANEKSDYADQREGVVVRIHDSFDDADFSKCVMKWVRKDHVQTDDHWKNQQIVKNKLKI